MVFSRKIYLQKLIAGMQNDMVKIVTGIRRCGKSYLLLEYGFNNVFYHLTEHTKLALTDFIFVRDFNKSVVVIREEDKSYLK